MQGRATECSVGAPRRSPHRVTLKLSGAAAVPAVCGLIRPVILLPEALAARLSAAQMEAVLLHELAHVRRGDPWVNYAQALLQVSISTIRSSGLPTPPFAARARKPWTNWSSCRWPTRPRSIPNPP